MSYLTKREKVDQLNKLSKSNNIKKFFIITSLILSIWLIIFLTVSITLSVSGNDIFNFFKVVDTNGFIFGRIDGITPLGWAVFVESIITLIFDVIALVFAIMFKTTERLVAEAIEVVTLH